MSEYGALGVLDSVSPKYRAGNAGYHTRDIGTKAPVRMSFWVQKPYGQWQTHLLR